MSISRASIMAMTHTPVWTLAAVIIMTVGCGTPQAKSTSTIDSTTSRSVPIKDRAALAAEIREHARYLDDRAAREDRHADELSNKVGPADEGILYQTRSLAEELRRQAVEARRMADRIGGSPDVARNYYASAGQLYRQEAQRLQAQADAYEQQAASISPVEDPKGFRRNELIMAAQRNRQEANTMWTRYSAYAERGAQP